MTTLYKRNGKDILYWDAIEISNRAGRIYTGIVGKPEGEPQDIKTGFFPPSNHMLVRKFKNSKQKDTAMRTTIKLLL